MLGGVCDWAREVLNCEQMEKQPLYSVFLHTITLIFSCALTKVQFLQS